MKLRKFVIFIIVISVMATLLSCDPGYRILVNDSEKVEINFNNSKIVLSPATIDKVGYWIEIKYDLESNITIHTDNVNVEYKGEAIEYHFTKGAKKIKDKNYTLNGSSKLFLEFDILKDKYPKKVKEGDTIRITAPDFITYNGQNLSLVELILVVGERL